MLSRKLSDGFVVIDKPLGPTSHQVTSWVADMLKAKKFGHAGTLDPNASGVLPIALGKAIKLLEYLSKSDKEYVGIAKFEKSIDPGRFLEIANQFTGEIWQMPPKVSAVKRRLRKRTVYSLEFLEIRNDLVLFKAKVQHGTYIRKLISDWGELLGVKGSMLELRRIRSGPFDIKDAVILQDLKDAIVFYERGVSDELLSIVLPLEAGIKNMKKIYVKDSAVAAICHGADLAAPGVAKCDDGIRKNEAVALMTKESELIGIGISKMNSEEIRRSKKGIVAKTDKVIMDRNKYPKVWKSG